MTHNNNPGQRIVCAAVKFVLEDQTFVVPSVRHWDMVLRNLMDCCFDEVLLSKIEYADDVQGFLDNQGHFLNREDAWLVAKEANQIIRRCGGDVEIRIFIILSLLVLW